MERIQEVKYRGRITRKLYYKPDNHKYTVGSLVNDPMKKGEYIITDIEHNVDLPKDTRDLYKHEYTYSVLNYLNFIDEYYA